jgi:hypothetical protein
MHAIQLIFAAVGLFFVGLGLWGLQKIRCLHAKHEAVVASRVQIDGEIAEYILETDETTQYRGRIEYTVDGHRYQIHASEAVPTMMPLGEKVRIAYKRAMPSDAIEVTQNYSWDGTLSKFSILLGLIIVIAGLTA